MVTDYGMGRLHKHEGQFDLELEDAGDKNCTFIPIIMTDKGKTGATTTYVNPRSDNFSDEDTSPTVFVNSYVKKFQLELSVTVPPSGQETGIERLIYYWTPMCFTLDDIDADDDVSGRNISQITEIKKENTTENQLHPQWNGTDCTNGSTLHADVAGLTGGQTYEYVTFDHSIWEDEIENSQLKKKIKSIIMAPDMIRSAVDPENPFYKKQWYDLPPKIRGLNHHSFYGFLIWAPKSGELEQLYTTAETTDVAHLRFQYKVKFWEYNDEFIQAAI